MGKRSQAPNPNLFVERHWDLGEGLGMAKLVASIEAGRLELTGKDGYTVADGRDTKCR